MKAPVLESLFNKVIFLIKRILQHRSLPVNIANLLRTPILKKICERLLLSVRRSDKFFIYTICFKGKTQKFNHLSFCSISY